MAVKMRGVRHVVGVILIALFAAGCSGTSDGAASIAEGEGSVFCVIAAGEVVQLLEDFVMPFSDLSMAEFLEQPDLPGLDTFQNDAAAIVQRVASDPNDECTANDLEAQVSEAVQGYTSDSPLAQSLVASIASDLQIERRDVAVTPDDDLLKILPLLGPGSSVRFSQGEFELDATLLVQTELFLVGAGIDKTVLRSSAEAAAIAVLGTGSLLINDMAIEHVGTAPASVIIDFEAPLSIERVRISGAIAEEDGSGGSGVVISATNELAEDPEVAITIGNSVISNNASAGIAVTSDLQPLIAETSVLDNEQCGICYFDRAAGIARLNLFEGNGVGVQASGTSAVEISSNQFTNNTVAGMLIEEQSQATVLGNTFAGEEIVGIDVQGDATPQLTGNVFGPHAVAISLRGASEAEVMNNIISGGDVGVLVGGSARPNISRTEIQDTLISSMLHSETSSATVSDNVISIADGAAVVVEGSASPTYTANLVAGGIVGMVFRESATGVAHSNTFEDQQVGIEAGDESGPEISGNTFRRQTEAGVIFSGSGSASLVENSFEDQVAIGIQAGGSGAPMIEGNTVEGGDTGALVTEDSQARFVDNQFENQNFGFGISDAAQPLIQENRIENASAGAISFEDESGGLVTTNDIVDAGVVGIRVAGLAAPDIQANSIFALVGEGAADAEQTQVEEIDPAVLSQSGAGLLYADQGAGSAGLNQVFGFVIGIQVSDNASPDLQSNRVDGAGIGGVGILYGVAGSGTATENVVSNQQLGFQLSGTANPELTSNTVERAAVAAFLMQGQSTPTAATNVCTASAAGIVILEQAEPLLDANECAILQQ